MAATNVQAFSGDVEIASNLAVDTNVLFVDSVNNKVGVGTTSPQEKIHIYGSPMIQHDTTYENISGGNGWYKLGVWKGSNSTGQGANLKLTLLGGSGYDTNNNNKSGETVIYAKLLNNFNAGVANIGGMFHSVGNPVVYNVKFKQVSSNRDEYEVHAETPSYTKHNMSVECSVTTSFTRDFTVSSDPGGDSATVRAAKFTHVINESGNVGIGFTDPSEKLHVNGPVYKNWGLNAEGFVIYNSASYKMGLKQDNRELVIFTKTPDNDGDIRFKPNDVQKMVLKENGRLGIGRTDPQRELDVAGNINLNGSGRTIYFDTTGGSGLYWGGGNSRIVDDGNLRICTDDDTHFNSGCSSSTLGTERMVIKSDGKVGIGYGSPICKLDLAGAIHLRAENLTNAVLYTSPDNSNMTNTYIAFGYAGTDNDWAFLRQFGPSNGMEIVFDFHDDGNDARFAIRDVQSTVNPDIVSTRFRVNSSAVDIPGSLTVAGSGVSSDDRIKYNESDIPNALNLINKLKPQKYEKLIAVSVDDKRGIWMPLDEEWESVKDDYEYMHEFGFIAQDVREIPELAFLVTGEETKMMTTIKTPIEYSNLTKDEQGTYTPSYVYGKKSITQEEYSNLISNEQELYTLEYVKEIETQNPLALNYNSLFVLAIGAIKELKAKNDNLEAQVANLLERVTALESI